MEKEKEEGKRKEEEGKAHEEGGDRGEAFVRKARDRRKRNAVRKKE